MHLYLIRHAESDKEPSGWLPENPFRPDERLTDKGRSQVEALATWIPATLSPVTALYTSDLRRALDTGWPIARACGVPAVIDVRLRDFGGNRADGTPYPNDAIPRRKTGISIVEEPYTGIADDEAGESFMDARKRAARFLDEMCRRHLGKNVVAVTHSGVIDAIFDTVFNVGPHRTAGVLVPPGSVTYVEYSPADPYETWMVYYVGRTDHLAGII